MAEPSPGDHAARVDAAVRGHYETTENFERRRGLNDFAVDTPPHRLLLDYFDWSPDAVVFDVGCGDGLWATQAAARTPQGAVVGIDASFGMLDATRLRDRRVHVVRADGNVLPMPDASADVVLAAWMLYHVDLSRALPEFVRVLRPGGRCIATTSDAELLPGLEDLVRDAACEVAGRAVSSPLGYLRFNVDNGAGALRQVFTRVEATVHETGYEVPVAAPILAFVESVRAPAGARLGAGFDFDAFLRALEQRLEARLRDAPITMTRRTAFFVAYP